MRLIWSDQIPDNRNNKITNIIARADSLESKYPILP